MCQMGQAKTSKCSMSKNELDVVFNPTDVEIKCQCRQTVTWNHLMKSFDVVGNHVTLSTDFVNEPRDKSRDSHADLAHVRVIRSTLGITAVTLCNTTQHTSTLVTYPQTPKTAVQTKQIKMLPAFSI